MDGSILWKIATISSVGIVSMRNGALYEPRLLYMGPLMVIPISIPRAIPIPIVAALNALFEGETA